MSAASRDRRFGERAALARRYCRAAAALPKSRRNEALFSMHVLPRMTRWFLFCAFSSATARASSYVAPPTTKMKMSCVDTA